MRQVDNADLNITRNGKDCVVRSRNGTRWGKGTNKPMRIVTRNVARESRHSNVPDTLRA